MANAQEQRTDGPGSPVEGTPCATIIQRMMGESGGSCACLETASERGEGGCCAAMGPQMKAACRRFALYALVGLVGLIGGIALLVWAGFHFLG